MKLAEVAYPAETDTFPGAFFVRQLRKLIDASTTKAGAVRFEDSSREHLRIKTTSVGRTADGTRTFTVFVVDSSGVTTSPIMIPMVELEDHWTLKKHGDYYLMSRDTRMDEEVEDRPLMVSMLAKLIAAHFKKGGPPVYLVDEGIGANGLISGYEVVQAGFKVTIRAPASNSRLITYQNYHIEDGDLTLTQNKSAEDKRWELKFTET